jgi:hypothetical protein
MLFPASAPVKLRQSIFELVSCRFLLRGLSLLLKACSEHLHTDLVGKHLYSASVEITHVYKCGGLYRTCRRVGFGAGCLQWTCQQDSDGRE